MSCASAVLRCVHACVHVSLLCVARVAFAMRFWLYSFFAELLRQLDAIRLVKGHVVLRERC